MSKFANADLTRWKTEINPAPIIGSRVKLLRVNTEYEGLCPFHPDKNPSFKVYKIDGDGVWAFKCFGCGENGNVFQFVQKFDSIPFKAAVEKVLLEAGVQGWQDGQEQSEPDMPAREHKETETFPIESYRQATEALERAPKAQRWLAERGIKMDTARQFLIGYVASAEKITSRNAWLKDGWILFPTLSEDGQTVTAVKYRSLIAKKQMIDGKENSGILRAPNTSTTLYNLQTFRADQDVWLVEGEPDTLALAQTGRIVVGMPSASYKPTDEECALLSKAPRRFMAFDADKTGQAAAEALKKRLTGATFDVRWPSRRKDANDVLTNECGNNLKDFSALVDDIEARVTQTETEPLLRTGDDIQPERIKWMWENKIPLGKITLFAGNPDNGKSLATTSVAAICSRGGTWPETKISHPPADVLMMLGEDDLEDTAVPRLMAADADMKRIFFLEAVRPVQSEDREVQLDLDIPAMERQLERNPNIRLLIIDPISNYLGKVSMVAEQEVRSILIPLKRAAERFNVAVVLVMHLNKKNDLDAISRVGGAMAFIGVARCSWLFVRDVAEVEEDAGDGKTEKPAEKSADSFSMLRIKNNLVSSDRSGLSYTVAVRGIQAKDGSEIITPYVKWGSVVEGSADDRLNGGRGRAESSEPRGMGRPNDKLKKAITWLETYLQDGEPHPSKALFADAKDGAGIGKETLERAKDMLPIVVKKHEKYWYWQVVPNGQPKSDDEQAEQTPVEDQMDPQTEFEI
jgi:putative DNA primase/helicase